MRFDTNRVSPGPCRTKATFGFPESCLGGTPESAFRSGLPSQNAFGLPENRAADSSCDLTQVASRLGLTHTKATFGFPGKLLGRDPKIGLSPRASLAKRVRSSLFPKIGRPIRLAIERKSRLAWALSRKSDFRGSRKLLGAEPQNRPFAWGFPRKTRSAFTKIGRAI